ncbi:LysR family transcriptional regulator [Streptomyces nojiriensis]
MNELEVRELRYFIAVAEELNFSRAAGRLGMAQPPLSKAIAQMESRLGVRLLERTTRQVRLTNAGQVLLDQARIAVDAVHAAARRARRAGQPTPRLVVAVKPAGDAGLLREILAAYRGTGSHLPPPEVVVGGSGEPIAMLRDGRADVALLRSPFDGQGLDCQTLVVEPRLAVLPAGHRLAGRRRLRLSDLKGEPIPRWQGAAPATPPTTPDTTERKQAMATRARRPPTTLTRGRSWPASSNSWKWSRWGRQWRSWHAPPPSDTSVRTSSTGR